MAMNQHMRSLVALTIALFVVGVSRIEPVAAQTFNIGGVKVQSNSSNRNQSNRNQSSDADDEDNDSDRQGGRRSRNQSNPSSDKIPEQFKQLVPSQGGQGGAKGQGNFNPSRRPNQANNIPGNQQFNPQNPNWNRGGDNGFTIGTWNAGKWQGTRDAKKWTQAFGGNQQPFSNQWYKDHPKAWKYDNNNSNANLWIGGSLPGLYTWLGWGNVPQQYRVYYSQNASSQFNRGHYGDWYPLGVYSLMAGPGDPGTRMVQLAVDQHGHLAGNYYDMITGSNYSLSGDIRQQSQRASFGLNKNQFVRFRAPIYELLQPYGSITVSLPGGDQRWQFVRLEN